MKITFDGEIRRARDVCPVFTPGNITLRGNAIKGQRHKVVIRFADSDNVPDAPVTAYDGIGTQDLGSMSSDAYQLIIPFEARSLRGIDSPNLWWLTLTPDSNSYRFTTNFLDSTLWVQEHIGTDDSVNHFRVGLGGEELTTGYDPDSAFLLPGPLSILFPQARKKALDYALSLGRRAQEMKDVIDLLEVDPPGRSRFEMINDRTEA
jgi:hypothetical protein